MHSDTQTFDASLIVNKTGADVEARLVGATTQSNRSIDPGALRWTQAAFVLSPQTLAGFQLSLDPVGNPTQIVRSGSLAQTHTFAYDASDRLTSVCFQAGTCPGASDPFIRWTYDKVGNRLSEQRPAGTTSSSYDARDRLLSAGATSYTWDENGNALSAGSRTFSYDLANRLTSTTQGNTTTTYLYDGDGVRLQASTGSQAHRKTNFLWDVLGGLPQLALERDGNNALLRRYTYGRQRISLTSGSNTSYYIHDGLGSSVNLTSASGSTQWTWSYEPFGSLRSETKAPGNQPTNFLKFTGEYLDPTGLYHLRARHYDPSIGRFLSRDPAEQTVNEAVISVYAYVANRPTVMVDPSGEIFRPAQRGRQYANHASSRWTLGRIENAIPAPRFPALVNSPHGPSLAPLPPTPASGCLLAITPPYLNESEDQIEFILVWRCSRVISVSVLGVLRKNAALVDTWSNWNPFQFSGEHTLKEKCRGDTARYRSFGSLSLRAFAWPPWRSTAAESGRVKISC